LFPALIPTPDFTAKNTRLRPENRSRRSFA
jgi:hypothetical protein